MQHSLQCTCSECGMQAATTLASVQHVIMSLPAYLLQHATAVDGGLEHFPEAGAAANIGILMFRTAGHNLAEVRPSTLQLSPPLAFMMLERQDTGHHVV